MKVEVAYPGRIEVFDTDRFTETQPFRGKSMLADFELHYSNIKEMGLWLYAHCYAANDTYRTDDGSVPEARREMGWKFQLVAPREVPSVHSITVDGTLILLRIGNDLADITRLDRVSTLCTGTSGPIFNRIYQTYEYLANADKTLAVSDVLVAEKIGLSPESLKLALTAEKAQIPPTDNINEWMQETLEEGFSGEPPWNV